MMSIYIDIKSIIDLNDPRLKSIIYDFVYTIDYWIDYFKAVIEFH